MEDTSLRSHTVCFKILSPTSVNRKLDTISNCTAWAFGWSTTSEFLYYICNKLWLSIIIAVSPVLTLRVTAIVASTLVRSDSLQWACQKSKSVRNIIFWPKAQKSLKNQSVLVKPRVKFFVHFFAVNCKKVTCYSYWHLFHPLISYWHNQLQLLAPPLQLVAAMCYSCWHTVCCYWHFDTVAGIPTCFLCIQCSDIYSP